MFKDFFKIYKQQCSNKRNTVKINHKITKRNIKIEIIDQIRIAFIQNSKFINK